MFPQTEDSTQRYSVSADRHNRHNMDRQADCVQQKEKGTPKIIKISVKIRKTYLKIKLVEVLYATFLRMAL